MSWPWTTSLKARYWVACILTHWAYWHSPSCRDLAAGWQRPSSTLFQSVVFQRVKNPYKIKQGSCDFLSTYSPPSSLVTEEMQSYPQSKQYHSVLFHRQKGASRPKLVVQQLPPKDLQQPSQEFCLSLQPTGNNRTDWLTSCKSGARSSGS